MSLRPKCLQNENNYEIVGLIQLRTDREKGKASDVDEGDGTAEDEQQPSDLRAHVQYSTYSTANTARWDGCVGHLVAEWDTTLSRSRATRECPGRHERAFAGLPDLGEILPGGLSDGLRILLGKVGVPTVSSSVSEGASCSTISCPPAALSDPMVSEFFRKPTLLGRGGIPLAGSLPDGHSLGKDVLSNEILLGLGKVGVEQGRPIL